MSFERRTANQWEGGTVRLRRARSPFLLELSYGHLWGLLFTPVQVITSSFGSDLPGPVSDEPPFVLPLFPTGSPAKVQLESGPAAVYVPPAVAHSCAGEAAYANEAKTKIAAASTAIPLSATTNRFFIPLSPLLPHLWSEPGRSRFRVGTLFLRHMKYKVLPAAFQVFLSTSASRDPCSDFSLPDERGLKAIPSDTQR